MAATSRSSSKHTDEPTPAAPLVDVTLTALDGSIATVSAALADRVASGLAGRAIGSLALREDGALTIVSDPDAQKVTLWD